MVKRLLSLLLTIAVLSTMALSTVVAADNGNASTGAAFYNQDKYANQVYNGDDLGFTYTPEATTWKVWSPAAEKVQLKLYTTGTDRENGAKVIGTYDLTKDANFASNGVWAVTLEGDYENVYYTYLVTVADTHGDVVTNETQDIYSKAVGNNGDRSMVVDLDDTDPEGWDTDKPHVTFDNISDMAVWELHIRDFSCDPDSGISKENQGNYLAFTEGGTTLQSDNSDEAISTGIDYLVEQGINTVQLMPFADYDQVDEINGDSATKRNWGYNPKNYNVPDGAYASDAYDGNVRINETKQMIQALHDRGIAVVMDVVYNHTAGYEASCFTKTVPGYYYRMYSDVQYANGSGQGCELASENAMTRNYIIQSMKYWVEEYHIDGFRFDLMACIDVTTLNEARKMLNGLYADGTGEKIPMYGEPWSGGSSACSEPAVPGNASKMLPGVGMFEANMRDASSNVTMNRGSGWITGDTAKTATIVNGIKADNVNSSYNNTQTVNYPECHDNLALWDQIVQAYTKKGEGKESQTVATDVNSTAEVHKDKLKLAGALFLTSQGITFMQAGTEFARTKQGQQNSYNSSDEINQLDWSRLVEYGDVAAYFKGLNRINDVYSPFSDDTEASEDTMKFISNSGSLIAYTIDNNTANAANEWGRVAVLLNNADAAASVELGEAGWEVVADGNRAGVSSLETVTGSTYVVDANSAAVLVKKESFIDFSDKYQFGTLTTNHYVDGTLTKTTTAKYQVGDTYHALKDAEILVDNVLDKTTGEASGTFTGDTTVDYYYVNSGKTFGTLTVNYVDGDGFTVTPSMKYTLEAGDAYSIPVCAVQGYQLNTNKYPANTTGTFDGADKEITFTYKELDSQVVTMHYYNSNPKWKTVLCYAYTDDGDEPLGAWAATSTNKTAKMTAEGDNWFKIDIPVSSCKVMFYSTSGSLGQEPGQNEPGYAVAGECWIENKQVTYSSTIIKSFIDINSGAKVGYDISTTEVKKNTDYYTTTPDGGSGTLVHTPANAAGFYQPGVTNVVYLFENGVTDPDYTSDTTPDTTGRYILGDANCDGVVNVNDVTFIQQNLVNLVFFDDNNNRNADVDGNYVVNIKDASYIQRYLVGLEVEYRIGRYFKAEDYIVPTEPDDEPAVVGSEVLFSDTNNWASKGDIYCYVWTSEGEVAPWPGVPMEFVGTNEYGQNQYSANLLVGCNFIVNNTYSQTVDLQYFGETGFYPTGVNAEGKFECGSW